MQQLVTDAKIFGNDIAKVNLSEAFVGELNSNLDKIKAGATSLSEIADKYSDQVIEDTSDQAAKALAAILKSSK